MLECYRISDQKLVDVNFRSIRVINTINSHSYCIAKNDPEFRNALLDSDMLLPDGIGVVIAEWFLYGKRNKKISGYDLFLFLMNKLNQEEGAVFFLGSSEENLERIKNRCSLDYPKIRFGSYSPPFTNSFSDEESEDMIDAVNNHKTDVLFLGMTAPKQEKWVNNFKRRLDAKIICSIGAVFDFYADPRKRAPRLLIKLGLEWLHRSVKDFKLMKRNLCSNPVFLWDTLKSKISNNNEDSYHNPR